MLKISDFCLDKQKLLIPKEILSVQFNKYETATNFIQLTQHLTADCLLIQLKKLVKTGKFKNQQTI